MNKNKNIQFCYLILICSFFIIACEEMEVASSSISQKKILKIEINKPKDRPYWTEGNVKQHTGATNAYASKSNFIRWQNKMGDWLDNDNTQQGALPIAVQVVSAKSNPKIYFNVKKVIAKWLNKPTENNGFYLSNKVKKNSRFRVYSHESQQTPPILEIITKDNKVSLVATRDTTLSLTERRSTGHLDYLTFKKDHVNLLYFDLSHLTLSPSDIIAAHFILTKYEKHRGGESRLEVYQVAPLPEESPVKYGIADQYHNDYGINSNPQVFIAEDFDNDDWLARFSDTRANARYNIIEPSVSTNKYSPLIGDALVIEFNPIQNLAFTGKYKLKELIEYEPQSLYFRYYVRLGDNWRSTLGGKFPGIAGTYNKAGWGGRQVNGKNGWSARGFFSTSVSGDEPFAGTTPLGSYVYQPDFNSRYGESIMWGSVRAALVTNRWYCIEQHIKLNDIGEKNGELNVWIDGISSYSRKNFRFRDVDTLKIETVWIDFYHGGTKKPKTVQEVYIDNIVIASDYIGPIRSLYK